MKSRLIYYFAMQGLGVFVMAIFLYLLWTEKKEATQQARSCNDKLIELAERQTIYLQRLDQHFTTLPQK